MPCSSRVAAALSSALLVLALAAPFASAQPTSIDTATDSLDSAIDSLDVTSPSTLSALRNAATLVSTALSAALAADSQYHHAASTRTTSAVNCANGFCDDRGRVNLLLGLDTLRAGYAKSYAAAATVSLANAEYAQAVGLPHGEATARANRFAMLSNATRTEYDIQRLNDLIRAAQADQRADVAFYELVVEAHEEANKKTLAALQRALQGLDDLDDSAPQPQLSETRSLLTTLADQLTTSGGGQQ